MSLTNKQAQDMITEQMEAVNKDKSLTIQEKSKLLAYLNNSQQRNSHVNIRAMRLVSTVTARGQKTLASPATLLKMPMLK